MSKRPILSDKDQATIEQARSTIFKAAPERFNLLFHFVPSPFDLLATSVAAAMLPAVRTLDVPTQPMTANVKQQLREYAAALFDAEAKYYSERTTDASELRRWLEELASEIAAEVRPIAAKTQLDGDCPASERLTAVNESLEKRVKELVDYKVRRSLEPTPKAGSSGFKVSEIEAMVESVLGGADRFRPKTIKTASTIPAPPNPWTIWEMNRDLPDTTATLRLHAACKVFREKTDSHILKNKELWRTVETNLTRGETNSHGEPDPEAMLAAFCKHCRWFLSEVSETFIDHIARRGLNGKAGIDAFKNHAQQFTLQAFENNWKWGLGVLPIGNVDDGVWTELSEGVREWKLQNLAVLWSYDEKQTATILSTPDELSPLVARRMGLLSEYKSATKNPSNRRIYTAKNSNIHKPQFHEWLKGLLPETSQTCINFERFLREKKPPIPRNR